MVSQTLPTLTTYSPANYCWQLTLSNGQKQKKKALIIGSWNIHNPLDGEDILRPQRQATLISRELAQYRINIAVLSETLLAEKGLICEPEGCYTFFWKGKAENEKRTHGSRIHHTNHILLPAFWSPNWCWWKAYEASFLTLKLSSCYDAI